MNEHAAELDTTTQELLTNILKKESHELTDNDKEVLRARSYYLKDKHKARYPEVFAETSPSPKKNRGSRAAKPADTTPAVETPVANLDHPADTQDQDDDEADSESADDDLDLDDDEAEG